MYDKIDVKELQDVIANVGSESPDSTQYTGIFKEDGLYLQQYPPEYAQYLKWFIDNNYSFDLTLDIGTASGGQTKFFRDVISCKRTIIIDNGTYWSFKYWRRIQKEVKSEIVLQLIEDSQHLHFNKQLLGYEGQLEFCFIDADHTENACYHDVELAMKLAKPGCLIALHDIKMCSGCQKVNNRLKQEKGLKHVFQTSDDVIRYGLSIFEFLG